MVELLGRCGPLQRDGAKRPLRDFGHPLSRSLQPRPKPEELRDTNAGGCPKCQARQRSCFG